MTFKKREKSVRKYKMAQFNIIVFVDSSEQLL